GDVEVLKGITAAEIWYIAGETPDFGHPHQAPPTDHPHRRLLSPLVKGGRSKERMPPPPNPEDGSRSGTRQGGVSLSSDGVGGEDGGAAVSGLFRRRRSEDGAGSLIATATELRNAGVIFRIAEYGGVSGIDFDWLGRLALVAGWKGGRRL
ncbi:hypothetical protein LINPERPRIM_LOCUS18439, partial [Linum perenne]